MDTTYRDKSVLMSGKDIDLALRRLALEIVDRNGGLDDVCLVGIYTRGVDLAGRLQKLLSAEEGREVPLGTVDIALYRDDDTLEPQVGPTRIPFKITDQVVVLVDDVLFTGRTARAALDALMDFGRPRRVQLLVLVDRGHRELPIQADYVGRACSARRSERVKLELEEVDGQDRVLLREPARDA